MPITFDEVIGTVEGQPTSEGEAEQQERAALPDPHPAQQLARQIRRLVQRTARLTAD